MHALITILWCKLIKYIDIIVEYIINSNVIFPVTEIIQHSVFRKTNHILKMFFYNKLVKNIFYFILCETKSDVSSSNSLR